MLTNKRIVIIHPGNPKFDFRLKKTVESLTAEGAEVIVLAYLSRPENDIKEWNCVSECRLRPYTLVKASNNKIWLLRVLWNLTIVRFQSFLERQVDECEGLFKVALELNPDLLYFINIESVEEAFKAAKAKINIPIIYEAYEYYPSVLRDNLYFSDSRRNAKLREIEKAVCSSPKVVTVVVGEEIAEGYQKHYGCARPEVIHNVAPYSISELPRHHGVPTFYFQSYLRPTYSIEHLIDAFLAVKGGAQLIIQGDAHEEGYFDSLKAYLDERNASTRIRLEPACMYEDIVNVASQYDIGLITVSATSSKGISENTMLALPNKLFTYMSAGLGIIAADYPAQSRMIIGGHLGLVYEPDNYNNLTEVMQKIVDCPESIRAMRETSLAMGKKFSLKNEMLKLSSICNRVISQGRSGH